VLVGIGFLVLTIGLINPAQTARARSERQATAVPVTG